MCYLQSSILRVTGKVARLGFLVFRGYIECTILGVFGTLGTLGTLGTFGTITL